MGCTGFLRALFGRRKRGEDDEEALLPAARPVTPPPPPPPSPSPPGSPLPGAGCAGAVSRPWGSQLNFEDWVASQFQDMGSLWTGYQ
ncbi:hypothetical protein LTR53_014855 [Teratosphaeriaceae sp. CCFEE 6253]|nr:hypothetical protein LTR53_014855 [Teratosphaeriaceae sp. CCFEE 6253]